MAYNTNSWEMPGLNFRSGIFPGSGNSNYVNNYGRTASVNTPLGRVPVAPPLPPRPTLLSGTSYYNPQTSSYLNNYGNYLGGYGYGLGGYGYRPYSYNYGMGLNGYYPSSNPESRFIQFAEESSRPAFQTIQSILQAFSSVTMMFESSFNAIYSSYMSVIGVADNFAKLRATFGQIFSIFAIFRAFRWLFRKILYNIGISKTNPEIEAIWVDAFNRATNLQSNQSETNRKPIWSTILFLSMIMSGPYLLFKLMTHIYPNPTLEKWNPSMNPGSLAVGIYDFNPSSDQELAFSVNEKIMIAPEKYQCSDSREWLLACNENQKIGLVPHNYIGKLVKSQLNGKTYIEHNGQKFEPNIIAEEPNRKPEISSSNKESTPAIENKDQSN